MHSLFTINRQRPTYLGIVALWAAFLPLSHAAPLALSTTSVSVAAGSVMDSFQVNLTNTGAAAQTLGGFSFSLSVPGGISLTDANTGTAATYIFAGNSFFGPDLSGPTSGSSISASDIALTPGSGAILQPGATLGLAQILFNVPLGTAPGFYGISFLPFPSSSLSDALGNDVTISVFAPGQITVTTTSEPAFFPLLLVMTLSILLFKSKLKALPITAFFLHGIQR